MKRAHTKHTEWGTAPAIAAVAECWFVPGDPRRAPLRASLVSFGANFYTADQSYTQKPSTHTRVQRTRHRAQSRQDTKRLRDQCDKMRSNYPSNHTLTTPYPCSLAHPSYDSRRTSVWDGNPAHKSRQLPRLVADVSQN